MGYYKKKRRSTKRKERLVTYSLIPTVGMAGILLTSYLSSTPLTIAGIPPSIIFSAVQDKGVISAFVTGKSEIATFTNAFMTIVAMWEQITKLLLAAI
ncbi:MAG: hypothetical protein BRC52_14745 [Cyanobacteria bacterium SW_5_48_44]|nr:MAG: hypothetical protein BRC52_14745 [Cyanobacteria bacterium SW_5_48_44]